jgi:hypothetical protein
MNYFKKSILVFEVILNSGYTITSFLISSSLVAMTTAADRSTQKKSVEEACAPARAFSQLHRQTD